MAKRRQLRGNRLARSARNAYESTRDRVEDARDRAEQTIAENPFSSIAIAAGVGAIVGIVVTSLMARPQKDFLGRLRDYF